MSEHRDESRIFTLEEANALVPRLSGLVERQLFLASEIESLLRRVRGSKPHRERVTFNLEPAPGDSAMVRADKVALGANVAAYEQGWNVITALGVVVKDPRTGLCDFHGHVDGRLVCLCWRYGETAIEHYHELDAGFAGRKPLGPSIRARMLN
jgi:hypothetical protein